jgi:Protein of unknown function (DUF3102)
VTAVTAVPDPDAVPESLAAVCYDTLPPEAATALRLSAKRIRVPGQKQNEAIVEIGRERIAAKEQLPHGQFTAWVAAEFAINERAATQYINVAE